MKDLGKPANVGYARQTSGEPSLETQVAILKAANCDKIYADPYPPVQEPQRMEIGLMLATLEKGDTVFVERITLLGRTSYDILPIVKAFIALEVNLVCLREEIDTRVESGYRQLLLLESLVENDRQAFLERIQAGLAAAEKDGVVRGRKKTGLSEKYRGIAKHLYAMHKSGEYSTNEVMEHFEIKSRSTFYKITNHWKAEKENQKC